MTLFCVERRKSWRQLQSRAGIVNKDYKAQQALLAKVDNEEIELSEFLNNTLELYEKELEALGVEAGGKKPAAVGAK
jgi:pyruvate-ferredoxin/flavodoxin oxidoreductase